jgi:hypothetical protein
MNSTKIGNLTILCLNIEGLGPSKNTTEKIKYIKNLNSIYNPDFTILTETNNVHYTQMRELQISHLNSNPLIKMGQGIAIITNPLTSWKIEYYKEEFIGRRTDLKINNDETLDRNADRVIYSGEIRKLRKELNINNPDIQPWTTLLKCSLPAEVRYTCWRLLMGVLPINRGIPCPLCHEKPSIHHLFWECPLATNLIDFLSNSHPTFIATTYTKAKLYLALCSTDLIEHDYVAPHYYSSIQFG